MSQESQIILTNSSFHSMPGSELDKNKSFNFRNYVLNYLKFIKELCALIPSKTQNEETQTKFTELKSILVQMHIGLLKLDEQIIDGNKKYRSIKNNVLEIISQIPSPENPASFDFSSPKENIFLKIKIQNLKEKAEDVKQLNEQIINNFVSPDNWVGLFHNLKGSEKAGDQEYLEDIDKLNDNEYKEEIRKFDEEIKSLENDESDILKDIENAKFNIRLLENNKSQDQAKLDDLTEVKNEIRTHLKELELKKFNDLKSIQYKMDIMEKNEKKRIKEASENFNNLMIKVNEQYAQITDQINQENKNKNKKTNFILIIDQSSSMDNIINSINKSAHSFMKKIKNIDNDNIYGSVIYFNDSAFIALEPTLLKSCNLENIFVQKAEGNTNYSKAFEKLFAMIEKNINKNDINNFNVIFFTDGEDNGDQENLKKTLRGLTFLTNNINFIARGFGENFSKKGKKTLETICNFFPQKNHMLKNSLKLNQLEISKNLDEIINFFNDIGESYEIYYQEFRKKIYSLTKFKEFCQNMEKKSINNSTYDEEREELSQIYKKNLKNDKVDSDLANTLNKKIEKMDKESKSIKEFIEKYQKEKEILLKEIDRLEKVQNEKKEELKEKFIKRMDAKKALNQYVEEYKIKKKNYQEKNKEKLKKMISHLGFSNETEYHKFYNTIESLDEFYLNLKEMISKLKETLEKTYEVAQTIIFVVEGEISRNRVNEIQDMIFEKAKGKEKGLCEIMIKSIKITNDKFGVEEIEEIASQEQFLKDLIMEPKKLEDRNEFINEKIDHIFQKEDNQILKNEINDLEKEIQSLNKWEEQSDLVEFQKKIDQQESDLQNLQDNDNQERKEKIEEIKVMKKDKKELEKKLKEESKTKIDMLKSQVKDCKQKMKIQEKEQNIKKRKIFYAVEQVYNLLQRWDFENIKRKQLNKLGGALNNATKKMEEIDFEEKLIIMKNV